MITTHGRIESVRPLTGAEVKALWKTLRKMYSRRRGGQGKNTIDNINFLVRTDGIHYNIAAINGQKTERAVVGSIIGGLNRSIGQRGLFH